MSREYASFVTWQTRTRNSDITVRRSIFQMSRAMAVTRGFRSPPLIFLVVDEVKDFVASSRDRAAQESLQPLIGAVLTTRRTPAL